MRFLILGRSVGLKKKAKKIVTRSLGIGGLGNTGRMTVKNVPVFVPVFPYAVTMLIFQIKRIISSEK